MSNQHNHDHDIPQGRCCPVDTNDGHSHSHGGGGKFDWILWGSLLLLIISIGGSALLSILMENPPILLHHFAHAATQILLSMWWGIALGLIFIGIMSKIPRNFFIAIMGKDNTKSGLFRAVLGGVFLDLCCHGILLIAAKLYERGVSLAQVVAFLVASPWNSFSLTLVLIGLIGFKWTMLYIVGSMLIAIVSGLILQYAVGSGKLPSNPNTPDSDEVFDLKQETISLLKSIKFTKFGLWDILKTGWLDGKMIIKWLLFGTLIAASIRTFIPVEMFSEWLGPTAFGLLMTLIIATIVEICSEGSAPIAGEIVTSAHAPGNGFTFLMAGVATDYTEFMAIREFTKSWKIALAIPLITVPQVLFIGYIMNMAAH